MELVYPEREKVHRYETPERSPSRLHNEKDVYNEEN